MYSPTFPSFQEKYKSFNNPAPGQTTPNSYFHAHPIGEIVRSLFFSFVLWMLLAMVLYGVYSLVVG